MNGFKFPLSFSVQELGVSGSTSVKVAKLNYSAVMPQFNLIHLNKECVQAKARVRQKKVCEVCSKELSSEEIGKRYEEAVFTKEEYKAISNATKGIELTKVVPSKELKPYQMKEPYALFFDLKKKKGEPQYTSIEAQNFQFLLTLLNNKPFSMVGKMTDRTEKLVMLTVENWTPFLTELAFSHDSKMNDFIEEYAETVEELALTEKAKQSEELEAVLKEKFSNAVFNWNDYNNTIKERVQAVIKRKLENKPLTVEAKTPKVCEQSADIFNEMLAKVKTK